MSPVPPVCHDPEPEEVDSVADRLAGPVDGRDRPHLDQIMWNILAGMAGVPATVVPVGQTAEGLLVGAQVVARRHADPLAIAFTGIVGELAGGYAAPPGFA